MEKPYDNLRALTAWDEFGDIKLVCKIQDPETKVWKRGIKTIKNFDWYFVIQSSDLPKAEPIIDYYYNREVVSRIEVYKETWVKVYCTRQKAVHITKDHSARQYSYYDMLKELRSEGVVLFEADLSMWKRFVTDNTIQVATDLDIFYFDIETDDSHDGIEIGRDMILSWAAVNQKGEQFYAVNDGMPGGEERLLREFLNVANNYDLLCGWNSGGFDLPYIQERLAKLHINSGDFFKKKLHIDMMQRCARIYSYNMFNIGLKGFSLNEVVRVFLNNESKIEHKQSILEMWQQNPELLKEYNIKDADLLYRLDKKLLITDLMIKECGWTGAFLDRFYIGELLDNYILRRTRELDFYQHERPPRENSAMLDDINIRGGYVMSPLPGIYDNVRVCDFRSLYPSLMVGFNIGRDSLNKDLSDEGFVAMDNFLTVDKAKGTKRKIEDTPFEEWKAFLESEKKRLDPDNKHIQAANNTFFRRDVQSFVGALVKHLLDLRAQWKAQAKGLPKDSPEAINIAQSQGIVKEMANSMYGITGDKSSRYFDQHVAEAITLTGQYTNRLSSYFSEQRGFTTIYGDTDSIFLPVDSDEDMAKLTTDVNDDLKNWLDNDIQSADNIVLLQYEKKFSRLILLDKKRYTGRITESDGVKTNMLFSRGTENIKKSTIKVARAAMIELINRLLDKTMTKDQARRWVDELRSKILYTELTPDELSMIIKISKSTEKYVAKPLHVRLAERLIREGKLLPIVEGKRAWGTRLDYIVIRMEDGSQEGVLLEEYKGGWDRTYYWDVQVFAPVRRVLETAWPEIDWTDYEVGLADKKFNEKVRRETKIIKQIEAEKEKFRKLEEKAMTKAKKDAILVEKAQAKREKFKASVTKVAKPKQLKLPL
jgi:DNA polymerase elongation subunit (family B)